MEVLGRQLSGCLVVKLTADGLQLMAIGGQWLLIKDKPTLEALQHIPCQPSSLLLKNVDTTLTFSVKVSCLCLDRVCSTFMIRIWECRI